MQMLYNTVCCEQRENCKYDKEGQCQGIPYDIDIRYCPLILSKKVSRHIFI